jgi:hypothetical protein
MVGSLNFDMGKNTEKTLGGLTLVGVFLEGPTVTC